MAEKAKRKTDIGPPNHEQFLPPVIKNNYGKWKYHENPQPGVLVHTAHSGDKLYSVRAASARLMSIETIRLFADIADEFCGGHLRFTSRNNVEFLLDNEANVKPIRHRKKDRDRSDELVHRGGYISLGDIPGLEVALKRPGVCHARNDLTGNLHGEAQSKHQ